MEVKCSCGKTLSVAESLQGTTGACPFCGADVEYPARERRTSRIVIALGDQGRSIDREGTGRVVRGGKLADLDTEGRKKLVRAIVLAITAVLAVFGSFWLRGHWRENEYSQARDGAFMGIREAEASMAEGSVIKARQFYRGARDRIQWYLSQVDPLDAEMLEALADVEARIVALDQASVMPTGPVGPGGSSKPPRVPVAAPALTPEELGVLQEALEADPSQIFLGAAPEMKAGDFTALGLGIHPESSVEDFERIWGARDPLKTEPGFYLITHARADGFDVRVREADAEQGLEARVDRIQIYPNFIGTVNGFSVLGTTPAHWQRQVGPGEEGSSEMLIRYKRPFNGWVSFDKDGKFTRLRISFQERL